MSRSYKKTPILKDGYGNKCIRWSKRASNKKVRRTNEIYNGKAYRKVYETWDIHDYFFRQSLNEYIIERENTIKSHINENKEFNEISKFEIEELKDKKFKSWKKYYYWK